jgi:oxysterol-binding protein 1
MKRVSTEKPRQSGGFSSELSTPLHLAVQCAPSSMVAYVISKGVVEVSARNKAGNTALHLAAIQGREDVVELLLDQPDMDDSIANNDGKQVKPRNHIR